INMKGYEIERADNSGIFKPIIFIQAINSLKNQSYSTIDKDALANASTVQYRLNQIDGDGSSQYSRIITLKSGAPVTEIIFANPFTGALQLQLNLFTPQTVSINVYDMLGRQVATERPVRYSASSNIIHLYSTRNLKAGNYILRLNLGTNHYVYKVMK